MPRRFEAWTPASLEGLPAAKPGNFTLFSLEEPQSVRGIAMLSRAAGISRRDSYLVGGHVAWARRPAEGPVGPPLVAALSRGALNAGYGVAS